MTAVPLFNTMNTGSSGLSVVTRETVIQAVVTKANKPADASDDTQEPDNTGTVVGVSVTIVILVIVGVLGFLWYLRRRMREPLKAETKGRGQSGRGQSRKDRYSESSTTWHEIETNSNRSSAVSNSVDYGAEDAGIEMQPGGRFPGSGMSMFDERDSLDDDMNPTPAYKIGTVNEGYDDEENDDKNTYDVPPRYLPADDDDEQTYDADDEQTYDVPAHHSPAKERKTITEKVPKERVKSTDDKTAVVFDKHAKSFKIADSENDTKHEIETSTCGDSNVSPSTPVTNNYELAKVVPEDQTNGTSVEEDRGSVTDTYNLDGEPEGLEQDDIYMNVEITQEEVSISQTSDTVNHANNSSNQNKDSPETVAAIGDTGTINDTADTAVAQKVVQRKSVKPPVPQPRMSKRQSANTASETTNTNTDKADITKENGINETTVELPTNAGTVRLDEYVEYDPSDLDPVHLDYDDADPIYDVPINNKAIGDN